MLLTLDELAMAIQSCRHLVIPVKAPSWQAAPHPRSQSTSSWCVHVRMDTVTVTTVVFALSLVALAILIPLNGVWPALQDHAPCHCRELLVLSDLLHKEPDRGPIV